MSDASGAANGLTLDARVEYNHSRIQELSFKSGFRRGICVDVITDPGSYDFELFAKISDEEQGEEVDNTLYDTISRINVPRNTVIYTESEAKNDDLKFALPFFPEHIMMPIKPGESIWYFTLDEISYWLTRAAGDSISEDVNYSHFDRKFLSSDQGPQNAAETADNQQEEDDDLPGFNDGNEDEDGMSLLNLTYEKIIKGTWKNESENINFRFEPVPIYKKLPGDLVLQGSNNSAIVLGQERISNADEVEEISSCKYAYDSQGMIDIVVGRGNKFPTIEIENELGYAERDKITKEQPGTEGDPHISDSSRIILSQSEPIAFELTEDRYTIFGDEEPVPTPEASVNIISDHIKIYSRYDTEREEEVQGTIQLIRQGKKDAEGNDLEQGSSIILGKDGIIQMSGQKIFLGISKVDGGIFPDEELEELGSDNSQPYILYFELKNLMEKLIDDLDAFCGTLETHVSVPAGAQIVQMISACKTLKQSLGDRKEEIPTIASKRIFGE